MSKAAQEGQSDANTWMNENPRSDWEGAIRPGTLGADEALINALGVNEAAKFLGVARPHVNGELTKKAYEAFRAYARAWTATVEHALKSGSKKAAEANAIVATDPDGYARIVRANNNTSAVAHSPIATRTYEYVVYPEASVSQTDRAVKVPMRRVGGTLRPYDLTDAKRVAKEMGPPAGIYSVSKGRFVGYIHPNGRYRYF